MEITYLGHSSFKIKGKNASLVTDPFDSEAVGLKFPKVEADIVTISHEHQDHCEAKAVGGNPFVIFGAGEYEVKGINIFGFSTFHDSKGGDERGQNTVYLIEIDNMKLVHLGDLGEKLKGEALEELTGCDILFIPVGGVYTIDFKEAVEIVTSLEPKIVIPMHYQVEGLNPKIYEELTPVENFLKEIGEEADREVKLVMTVDSLPEERKVVVLERKG